MADDDAEDAFAATVAPAAPSGPIVPPGGRPRAAAAGGKAEPQRPRRPSAIEASETVAAPPSAAANATVDGPRLPIIDVDTYILDKEIARGGMGRIVAAEDQRLGRRVALKVLLEPAGDQLGRFQREALITARLQHPGIVPVYEAGRWPSGEPFFAMKLVSGRPLDRVIADLATLDERLAILPRVAAAADAIAYAHSQRVVHRDLKPANVLIGDFGETVVIDWGLAKDLDAGDSLDSAARPPRPVKVPLTLEPERIPGTPSPRPPAAEESRSSTLTIAGAVMGTPAYMAPEQARGESVDQRADVFALGAMLYHLLAGTPPYNARTATDVIAAAALGRVVPLVQREERAPADLVAIVERAMMQDPEQRYPDAGALADELRRFLTGQLVSAHRYTRTQRIARFVRKNRAAVTIAAIAVVGFAIGGTVSVRSIVQARDRAEHEKGLSDARRDAAETLIDELLHGMRDKLAGIGQLEVLSSLGENIQGYYEALGSMRDSGAIEGLDRLAKAADVVGTAQRDQGDIENAMKTFTQARAQLQAAVGTGTTPRTFPERVMIARLEFDLGTCRQQMGQHPAAQERYLAAEQQFASLAAELPSDWATLMYAAENHDRIGDLARNEGKLDIAYEHYSDARTLRTTAAAGKSAMTRGYEGPAAIATSELKLGSIYQARADTTAAFAAYRNSLHLRETVLEVDPANADRQMRVLEVEDAIAELQRELGDSKSAVATYLRAMPIMNELVARDTTNKAWARMQGNLLADLGFSLLDAGEFAEALAQLDAAASKQQELLARDATSAQWSMDLARTHLRAGDVLVALGRYPDAIARYEESMQIRGGLAAKDPKSLAYARAVAWCDHKLGNVYALEGDSKHALALHELALPLRTRLVAASPKHTGYANELASTEVTLGRLLAAHDPVRAEALVSTGLERARTLAAADPASNEWKETVVQGLLARAVVAHAAKHPDAERAALVEAASIAQQAAVKAPQSAEWPGFLAEVQAGFAALAGPDRAAQVAAWKAVRALLEPLDTAGHLPASRKPLLAQARAFK